MPRPRHSLTYVNSGVPSENAIGTENVPRPTALPARPPPARRGMIRGMRMSTFTRTLIVGTCGLAGAFSGFFVVGYLVCWWHGGSGFFGLGFLYYGICGAPLGLAIGIAASIWLTRSRCAGCKRPIGPDQSRCPCCGWPRDGVHAISILNEATRQSDDPEILSP
jgi:hypothetical protein